MTITCRSVGAVLLGLMQLGIWLKTPVALGATPDEAMALSHVSGRPLLALASSPQCVPCQRLKSLITRDAGVMCAIRPYVFLEMDHASHDFSRFRAKYPVEVPGVPMVYVVRADGTLMYGRFGGMTASELTTLLQENASRAGQVLSPSQTDKLEVTLATARQHFSAGEVYPALRLIDTAAGIPSYAASVREAQATRRQIIQAIEGWLAKLDRQLRDGINTHTAAYQLAHMYVNTKSVPQIRQRAGVLLTKYETQPQTAVAVRQGKELVRARLQEARDADDQAIASYQRILQLDDDSPTALHARKKLQALRMQQQEKRGRTANISGPDRLSYPRLVGIASKESKWSVSR